MKLAVESNVKGVNPEEVYSLFDVELLCALSPPFMKPQPLVHEGNHLGAQLVLRLKNPLFSSVWKGHVTEEKHTENEIYFVDEGIEMPFGMTAWRHKHRIIRAPFGTLIRDEVEFNTKNGLLTALLMPGVWLQLIYRKPLYEKIIKARLKR